MPAAISSFTTSRLPGNAAVCNAVQSDESRRVNKSINQMGDKMKVNESGESIEGTKVNLGRSIEQFEA